MQSRKQYLKEITAEIKNYSTQLSEVWLWYKRGYVTGDAASRYWLMDIKSKMGKSRNGQIRKYLILLDVIVKNILPKGRAKRVVLTCAEDIDLFIDRCNNLSEETIRELRRRANKCRQLV